EGGNLHVPLLRSLRVGGAGNAHELRGAQLAGRGDVDLEFALLHSGHERGVFSGGVARHEPGAGRGEQQDDSADDEPTTTENAHALRRDTVAGVSEHGYQTPLPDKPLTLGTLRYATRRGLQRPSSLPNEDQIPGTSRCPR